MQFLGNFNINEHKTKVLSNFNSLSTALSNVLLISHKSWAKAQLLGPGPDNRFEQYLTR